MCGQHSSGNFYGVHRSFLRHPACFNAALDTICGLENFLRKFVCSIIFVTSHKCFFCIETSTVNFFGKGGSLRPLPEGATEKGSLRKLTSLHVVCIVSLQSIKRVTCQLGDSCSVACVSDRCFRMPSKRARKALHLRRLLCLCLL